MRARARTQVYVPKEGVSIAFAPSGIKTPARPQAAGNGRPAVTGEPFADEAFAFTRDNFMQRDVSARRAYGVSRGGGVVFGCCGDPALCRGGLLVSGPLLLLSTSPSHRQTANKPPHRLRSRSRTSTRAARSWAPSPCRAPSPSTWASRWSSRGSRACSRSSPQTACKAGRSSRRRSRRPRRRASRCDPACLHLVFFAPASHCPPPLTLSILNPPTPTSNPPRPPDLGVLEPRGRQGGGRRR